MCCLRSQLCWPSGVGRRIAKTYGFSYLAQSAVGATRCRLPSDGSGGGHSWALRAGRLAGSVQGQAHPPENRFSDNVRSSPSRVVAGFTEANFGKMPEATSGSCIYTQQASQSHSSMGMGQVSDRALVPNATTTVDFSSRAGGKPKYRKTRMGMGRRP